MKLLLYKTNKLNIMREFLNKSGLEFSDISSEKFREYVYTDFSLTINDPLKLNVSKSGGHRVFSENGDSFYITPGWKYIKWQVKEGSPNFVR
jgi:hypothetical protein